jgi:hypothetical protein
VEDWSVITHSLHREYANPLDIVAHAIEDTLVLLASMRPQAPSSDGADGPTGVLTPSAATLQALQRSLPTVTSSCGWRGTLPASRPRALRDDRTLHVKPGVPAPAPAPARPPAPSARSATPTTAPGTPAGYATYPYSAYASAYGQYPYAAAAAGKPGAPGTGQPAAAYPYAAWYNGYATPVPPSSAPGTGYANFWGAQAPPPAGPPRAVANTVAPKSYAAWGGTAPTIPQHLRTGGAGSAPGTPAPVIPVPAAVAGQALPFPAATGYAATR